MKEMVYSDKKKCEIIESGVYLDHRYAILNLGTHPTAYVEKKAKCKNESNCKGIACKMDVLNVHGGITFCGQSKWPGSDSVYKCIGWDYAHFGDRYGKEVHLDEHSWTTEEILAEVKSAIEQLIRLEERR